MKIPSKVKVAGTNYKIVEVDKIDDSDTSGIFIWNESLIKLKASLSINAKCQTLLHECMHGIDQHYMDCAIEKQFGEQGIDVISNGFHQLIKQLEG